MAQVVAMLKLCTEFAHGQAATYSTKPVPVTREVVVSETAAPGVALVSVAEKVLPVLGCNKSVRITIMCEEASQAIRQRGLRTEEQQLPEADRPI